MRLIIFLLLNVQTICAQGIYIGSQSQPPDASAGLEVDFSNKGFLPPRLTEAERNAIAQPTEGLVIYNRDSQCLNFFDGSSWQSVCNTGVIQQPQVATLDCQGATIIGTVIEGQNATGITVAVDYTGGNGLAYAGWNYSSTGVAGLDLALTSGTLANGAGTITLSLSGSAQSSGNAQFLVSLGGQSCTLSVTVNSVPPITSGSFTFTPCGATGENGPSQVQCDQAYGPGIVSVSGGIQQWTAPVTATYTITAYGAQGGFSNVTSTAGGLGAMVQASFALTQGTVLRILPGQAGQSSNRIDGGGGGGGGASFIALQNNTALLVAAGGGGASASSNNGTIGGQGSATLVSVSAAGSNSTSSNNGGSGGGFSHSAGAVNQFGGSCGGWLTWNDGGGKGFTSGGVGGTVHPSLCNDQNFPRQGVGGFGSGGAASNVSGGGGGGYAGGNGGVSTTIPAQGGQSFNSGTLIQSSSGVRSGNGEVVISW